MKVAVFESEEHLARKIERSFRESGFETRWFRFPPDNTADEVSEYAPHLVTMDIVMDNMDGFQACENLKKDPRTAQIPIIFYSNLSSTEYVRRGISLGAAAYCTKSAYSPRSFVDESIRVLSATKRGNT